MASSSLSTIVCWGRILSANDEELHLDLREEKDKALDCLLGHGHSCKCVCVCVCVCVCIYEEGYV